jgi:hypothetical protein
MSNSLRLGLRRDLQYNRARHARENSQRQKQNKKLSKNKKRKKKEICAAVGVEKNIANVPSQRNNYKEKAI